MDAPGDHRCAGGMGRGPRRRSVQPDTVATLLAHTSSLRPRAAALRHLEQRDPSGRNDASHQARAMDRCRDPGTPSTLERRTRSPPCRRLGHWHTRAAREATRDHPIRVLGRRSPRRWHHPAAPRTAMVTRANRRRHRGMDRDPRTPPTIDRLAAQQLDCQWPSVSPHPRPSFLPTGGHVFSPLVATNLPTDQGVGWWPRSSPPAAVVRSVA